MRPADVSNPAGVALPRLSVEAISAAARRPRSDWRDFDSARWENSIFKFGIAGRREDAERQAAWRQLPFFPGAEYSAILAGLGVSPYLRGP